MSRYPYSTYFGGGPKDPEELSETYDSLVNKATTALKAVTRSECDVALAESRAKDSKTAYHGSYVKLASFSRDNGFEVPDHLPNPSKEDRKDSDEADMDASTYRSRMDASTYKSRMDISPTKTAMEEKKKAANSSSNEQNVPQTITTGGTTTTPSSNGNTAGGNAVPAPGSNAPPPSTPTRGTIPAVASSAAPPPSGAAFPPPQAPSPFAATVPTHNLQSPSPPPPFFGFHQPYASSSFPGGGYYGQQAGPFIPPMMPYGNQQSQYSQFGAAVNPYAGAPAPAPHVMPPNQPYQHSGQGNVGGGHQQYATAGGHHRTDEHNQPFDQRIHSLERFRREFEVPTRTSANRMVKDGLKNIVEALHTGGYRRNPNATDPTFSLPDPTTASKPTYLNLVIRLLAIPQKK